MKFSGNLLGQMRQQVGKAFVFSIWKGIQTARQYAKPSNPNTIPQQNVRNIFSFVQFTGQLFGINNINTYWRSFAVRMSAWNAFMKYNILLQEMPTDINKVILSKGTLTPTPITGSTYDNITGRYTLGWNVTAQGNQTAGDNMVGVGYSSEMPAFFVLDDDVERADGTMTIQGQPNLDFAKCRLWLFAYRNLGTSSQIISTSENAQCNEP